MKRSPINPVVAVVEADYRREHPLKFHASRALRAEKALDAYRIAIGEDGPHDPDRVRDLLQDLLHWLAQQGDDEPIDTLTEACQRACVDFPMELREDEA